MSQPLGKIERPEAAQFQSERKVFLVTLMLGGAGAPAEYGRLLDRYWTAVGHQIARLEERLGPVKHVYMEMTDQEGDEGLKGAEQVSAGAGRLARRFVEQGANLCAFEDADTLAEALDWERCLYMGLSSRKVAEQVMRAAREASERRYQFMAKRIDETLQEGESAVVLLTEQHRLAFPQNTHLFRVAPPELDEIQRWIRDYREPSREEPPDQAAGEPGAAEGQAAGPDH